MGERDFWTVLLQSTLQSICPNASRNAARGARKEINLNDDGVVSQNDIDFWFDEASRLNLPVGRDYTLADVNLDGENTIADWEILFANVGLTNRTSFGQGDVDFSGEVDAADVALYSEAGGIVPEPGSAALLGLGLVGLARMRTRQVSSFHEKRP